MTTKQRFIEILSALRLQHDSDVEYAKQVGEAIGAEINPYNNSLLVNCLIQELGTWFIKGDQAINEINRFMYDQNFGRHKGVPVIEPEDLWEYLLEINILRHNLITKK